MRRARRGVTITELLTVVSLITILTSFVSPVVVTVKHAALARVCSHNLRQVFLALQLNANAHYGKLPTCVTLNTTDNPLKLINYSLKEDEWWYRKVSRVLYKANDPLNGGYIPAEHNALRCPGSADPYDQSRVRGNYTKVNSADKDRVFDDCYGYNNFGFAYNVGDSQKEKKPAIPNPDTLKWGAIGNSFYYRSTAPSGGWGANVPIVGRPKHLLKPSTDPPLCDCGRPWPCKYTRLGEFTKVPEASRTILMMDYIKADVAPDLVNDGLRGFRFRHNGSANVMFVDGHVELMSRQEFQRKWAEPDHESWSKAAGASGTVGGAIDPATRHGRIHWAVLRP